MQTTVALGHSLFGLIFSFAASISLASVLTSSTSALSLITAFIVLGQGHFILTYLYKFRARKIGPLYVSLWVGTGILLCTLLLTHPSPEALLLFLAGTIFSLHFFFDELHFEERPLTYADYAFGASFGIFYSSFLYNAVYDTATSGYLLLLAGLLVIPQVIELLRKKSRSPSRFFLLALTFIIAMLSWGIWEFSAIVFFGMTVIFHYVRWYIYFLFRLQNDATKFSRYIYDVIFINAAVVALFILYALKLPIFSFLVYVFDPTFFYAWTILHVLFSVRFLDRKGPSKQQ